MIAPAFNTAVDVLNTLNNFPHGTEVEVARHKTAVIKVRRNAYKTGFAMSLHLPDGSEFGVCGCVKAAEANIDVMVGKARMYFDKFLATP